MAGLRPEAIWYPEGPGARLLGGLLAPLGWLWCTVAMLRRHGARRGWLASHSVGVPVLVVGNLTVGGTGKTPLVLWLVGFLRQRAGPGTWGRAPGIVLRGYGATGTDGRPRLVPADADPVDYGDEPVLLARRSGCPVAIGRDRVAAARLLVEDQGCDCVVADDGLQHLRLRRAVEIILIDGARGLGNGRCLPAGPLREPAGRLARDALVLVNGAATASAARGRPTMSMTPTHAVNLAQPTLTRPLQAFHGTPLTAVAGIGNPGRFFDMLRGLGLRIAARAYPDHHRFSAAEIAGWPPGPVLMTEKDAVKCQALAGPDHWFVPVTAEPEPAFVATLSSALDALG